MRQAIKRRSNARSNGSLGCLSGLPGWCRLRSMEFYCSELAMTLNNFLVLVPFLDFKPSEMVIGGWEKSSCLAFAQLSLVNIGGSIDLRPEFCVLILVGTKRKNADLEACVQNYLVENLTQLQPFGGCGGNFPDCYFRCV